ncbi:squalene/phytoene synthase family protein [Marinovum sp. 2_MG-2023]|uniref:squalene/phytoene synthase family protein n=1 Tax=unclassified Marinovum TaxID=2647166 RepID=UPI0026E39DB3|nr:MULTISPECIES: squalene/phytoene synthase family protein [unclassified Marinovum]MDO6730431.1 squalene/phytoene synthase family protein [Marinovum sp. 2_MG-2023]MDO6778411.1 squalene/phytoene synthase family protein [Marinovum sp. 1_MG-2023]
MTVDGWQACAAIVEKGDPDRFMATMSTRVVARQRLFPLYAFNVEVSRAPWVTEEPMIAEMRLQWWRDALEEIAGGDKVRRHEVVTPLATVLRRAQVGPLDALIDARRWDIGRDPFEDRADFDSYIDATAGNLLWVAAEWFGCTQETPVRDIAYGAGVAQYLSAVPELEARGRVPLVDGRPEAVQALAQDALDRLKRGKATYFMPAVREPLRATWQAEAILAQAISDPRLVAEGALGLSGFGKRALLLRRTWFGGF